MKVEGESKLNYAKYLSVDGEHGKRMVVVFGKKIFKKQNN